MSIRFRTGNKATIALTGTLTTGVTTSFVGNLVSIDPGEWQLGSRDVSVLSDDGFSRRDPNDLVTPNDITGVVRFDASVGVPSVDDLNVDTVTVTFPQQSTATSGVTQATLAGKGFFSRFKFPNMANNETMESEFTIELTGESIAFTAEA